MKYERLDNCFAWIEDVPTAQQLMDKQLQVVWQRLLTDLQRYAHPMHDEMFEGRPADYYWTAYQSEWATDIMFRDPKRLQAVYRDLVRLGILCLSSPDIRQHPRLLRPRSHLRYQA